MTQLFFIHFVKDLILKNCEMVFPVSNCSCKSKKERKIIKIFSKICNSSKNRTNKTLIQGALIIIERKLMLLDQIDVIIWLVGWLVGWVLWHINLCRLFNAESIFM